MLEKTLKLNRLSSLYGGLLTDKQKEALDLYYNCDMSLAELSVEMGVTRQGVRDFLTRAEKTLLDAEQKLGLRAKMDALVDKLTNVANEIDGEQKEALNKIIGELEE